MCQELFLALYEGYFTETLQQPYVKEIQKTWILLFLPLVYWLVTLHILSNLLVCHLSASEGCEF